MHGLEGVTAEWKMKTASLQTPFAYNLMNGDECYESMRSEVVSRHGRRGIRDALPLPAGRTGIAFLFHVSPWRKWELLISS
jgi:hypothetical protein